MKKNTAAAVFSVAAVLALLAAYAPGAIQRDCARDLTFWVCETAIGKLAM